MVVTTRQRPSRSRQPGEERSVECSLPSGDLIVGREIFIFACEQSISLTHPTKTQRGPNYPAELSQQKLPDGASKFDEGSTMAKEPIVIDLQTR